MGELLQKVISKTIIFIVVMIFIIIFKTIFGDSNTLVGVTTLVLILLSMDRNLTTNGGKNLLKLLIMNLVMGLGAFMVSQSLWLGLIINFTIMFFIAYFFSYELRKPLNMLVGLHYILMMTNPISVEELPLRIAALIVGPFLLMGVQLLTNKNQLKKSGPALLAKIEQNILVKINLLKEDQSVSDINHEIMKEMNRVKVMVHENTPLNTHVSLYGRTIIGVLSCLERINLLLDIPCDKALLDELGICLKEKTNLNLDSVKATFSKSYQEQGYEFISTLDLLAQEQDRLTVLLAQPDHSHEENEPVADEFKEGNILKRNFNYCSVRLGYGIRLGLLVALATFVTDYFKLEYGVWLTYTVFAITQPFIEYTVTKAKKRIIGTAIGAIIIFILFMIIPDPSMRAIILLVTGYVMSYAVDYRNIVMFITICSICAASGTDVVQSGILIFNRLFFVVIGIIISLIVNKFFLKSTYADEEKGIKALKVNILDYMFKEIYVNQRGGAKTIDHLYLIPPFIESRIEHWNLEISEERLYKQRWLMNYLHQVHLQLNSNTSNEQIIERIKVMLENESKDEVVARLNEMMSEIEDVNEWNLYSQSLMLVQQIHLV